MTETVKPTTLMHHTQISENEAWADVPGFERLYQVSTYGRVKSLDRDLLLSSGRRYTRRGKILTFNTKNGPLPYKRVKLCKDGIASLHLVHRLVLSAFVRLPVGNEHACHNNNDPTDNRLINLRWGTAADNLSDRHANGTHPSGELNSRSVLTSSSVRFIRDSQLPHKALALHFGISAKYVSNIKAKITWGNL